MWAMIGTWEMAFDGVSYGSHLLESGNRVDEALLAAVQMVEDEASYHSVGYGGLPNEVGIVEMDAAFMNGDNFQIGSVAGLQDVKNPVAVARKLSEERFNNVLVGDGARSYAMRSGFAMKNMLTKEAKNKWQKRLEQVQKEKLTPYAGHDTVCMVALDKQGSMASATSTSGLFMKKPGRVGDTPLSGSGFYVDSEIGGAAATGLGEDIMKGCLSFAIVRNMETGMSPQTACDQALFSFLKKLSRRNKHVGEISLVALNSKGEWGVATNVAFPFVVATQDQEVCSYLATSKNMEQTEIKYMNS